MKARFVRHSAKEYVEWKTRELLAYAECISKSFTDLLGELRGHLDRAKRNYLEKYIAERKKEGQTVVITPITAKEILDKSPDYYIYTVEEYIASITEKFNELSSHTQAIGQLKEIAEVIDNGRIPFVNRGGAFNGYDEFQVTYKKLQDMANMIKYDLDLYEGFIKMAISDVEKRQLTFTQQGDDFSVQ